MKRSYLTLSTTVVSGCKKADVARNKESISFNLGSESLTKRFIERYTRLGLTRTEIIRILVNNDVALAAKTTETNPEQKNE